MAEKPLPLLGYMDIFNPEVDDRSSYVERMESFFVASDVKDEKKVAVLVIVIGTKAYSLLRNIIVPAKAADKTYQELVEAIKSYLDPKMIVITKRFRFHRRNQREGETMAQYLAEPRKLTEHCNFRDEMLRDRLVCRILSVPIQKRL